MILSTATGWDLLVMLPAAVCAGYAIAWSIPGIIFGAVLALGDPQRIAWIDKQLSKDATKLHSDYQCMMSYNILSRFMNYCVVYPLIRNDEYQYIDQFSNSPLV